MQLSCSGRPSSPVRSASSRRGLLQLGVLCIGSSSLTIYARTKALFRCAGVGKFLQASGPFLLKQSLSIYIPDNTTLIEFNVTAWHNSSEASVVAKRTCPISRHAARKTHLATGGQHLPASFGWSGEWKVSCPVGLHTLHGAICRRPGNPLQPRRRRRSQRKAGTRRHRSVRSMRSSAQRRGQDNGMKASRPDSCSPATARFDIALQEIAKRLSVGRWSIKAEADVLRVAFVRLEWPFWGSGRAEVACGNGLMNSK